TSCLRSPPVARTGLGSAGAIPYIPPVARILLPGAGHRHRSLMPLAPEGRLAIPALMLSLLLLRHAKSSWKNSALQDLERTLDPRGKRADPRMGAYMAAQGLPPDLVLSSTAVRARQTLDLVVPHLSGAPRIEYERGLYLATSADLLSRLRELKSAAR